MKTRKLSILLLSFLLCLLTAVQAQVDRTILKKTIHVTKSTIRLDSLVRNFTKQTGVEFSFNSNKVNAARSIVVTKRSQSLTQWLHQLDIRGIGHKFVGNHIVLIADPSNARSVSKAKPSTTKSSPFQEPLRSTLPASNQSSQERVPEKSSLDTIPTMTSTPQVWKLITDTLKLLDSATGRLETFVRLDTSNKRASNGLVAPRTEVAEPVDDKSIIDLGNENASAARGKMQIIFGPSRHGSGDMKGVTFGTEFLQYLNRRLSLTYSLRGTIHSDKFEYIYKDAMGSVQDASLRFTTAGLQLGILGGVDFLQTKNHIAALKLGVIGRYQSASHGTDGYAYINPLVTNYPRVLLEFGNSSPQHTYAFGGLLELDYKFAVSQSIFTGVFAGIQTDTNGDLIYGAGIKIAHQFGR